jgi:hypothetical protein
MYVSLTDVKVRNEGRHGFPSEDHRAYALSEKSKARPCGIRDKMAFVQEDEVQR